MRRSHADREPRAAMGKSSDPSAAAAWQAMACPGADRGGPGDDPMAGRARRPAPGRGDGLALVRSLDRPGQPGSTRAARDRVADGPARPKVLPGRHGRRHAHRRRRVVRRNHGGTRSQRGDGDCHGGVPRAPGRLTVRVRCPPGPSAAPDAASREEASPAVLDHALAGGFYRGFEVSAAIVPLALIVTIVSIRVGREDPAGGIAH